MHAILCLRVPVLWIFCQVLRINREGHPVGLDLQYADQIKKEIK